MGIPWESHSHAHLYSQAALCARQIDAGETVHGGCCGSWCRCTGICENIDATQLTKLQMRRRRKAPRCSAACADKTSGLLSGPRDARNREIPDDYMTRNSAVSVYRGIAIRQRLQQ